MECDDVDEFPMLGDDQEDLGAAVASRFRNSKATEHRHLCAAVEAMAQVLKDQNLPPSPTAYFAATMTSLERQAGDQSSVADDEPVAAALCTFLSMVLPKVSHTVLRSKWEATLDSLVKFLKRNSVSAGTAKFGMNCISYLLTTGDKSTWLPVESAYGVLLNYATDRRPKVRKRAHLCLEEVLRSYQCSSILVKASEGVEKIFEQFLLIAGGSNSVGTIGKPQVASNGANGAMEVVYILNALKVIAPLLSKKVISKLLPHFQLLLQLRQPFLTSHVMSVLHALCISPTAELPASGLADLLGWLCLVVFDDQKSGDAIMFAARVLQHGMGKVHDLDQNLCADKLPAIFHSLAGVLAFQHEEAIYGASEALQHLVQNCIDEEMITQGLNQLNMRGAKPAPIQRICTTAESLLGHEYNTAWDIALKVISTLFEKLGESSCFLMGGVLRNLADLQKLADEDLTCRKQLHKCVGSAVAAMGPDKFLDILPLNLDCEELSESNIWLLPILKQHIVGGSLKFFTNNILGLVDRLHEKSKMLEVEGRPVASRNTQACVHALWSLLPSFCNYPIDTAQNFLDLAKKLRASLLKEPDLRGIICSSLQILIQQNKKAQEEALNSLISLEQAERLEISLAEQRANSRYNSKVASENMKILRKISPEFLSTLFTIFMSSPQEKRGYLQATIADMASVADKAVVNHFFIRAMQKLLKVTQEATKSGHARKSSMEVDGSNNEQTAASTRAQLLDLAVSLLQGLDVEAVNMLFAATKPALQDDEGLVQKKAYKVLVGILKEHGDFLANNLDEIFELTVTTMPSCHFSAKRHRLDCLQYLIIHILMTGEERKNGGIACFLSEIILAVKESNKKTRSRAYDLLVKIGHCLEDTENGGSQEKLHKFFNMVVGCLAGSTPHMISAAVTGIARLMYEFSELCLSVPDLLPSVFMLLKSNNREVIKATLGLLKVVIARLQAEDLQKHLKSMVDGLLLWSADRKTHFKAKVRLLLEMLIRKCGLEAVKVVMPEQHVKLLANIRKVNERKEKRRNSVSQDKLDETKSSHSHATTTRQSKWNHTKIFSEFGDEDDDDSDADMDFTQTTHSGIRSSVPKSKSSTLRSKNVRKSNKRLPEDLDILGNEPLDLLDKQKARSMLKGQQRKGQRSDSEDEMVLDSDGRLVINEDDVGHSRKRRATDNGIRQDIDSWSQRSGQSKSHATSASLSNANNKRQKTAKSGWAYTGTEYKNKKAGGDIKRDGKLEPYAYWPLDAKMLNRREEKRSIAKKGLANVMKLSKQLQGKSVRQALSEKTTAQKRKQKSHNGKNKRKSS